jgi:lysine-specific demethylase/histidyl-hydroxylase NO66
MSGARKRARVTASSGDDGALQPWPGGTLAALLSPEPMSRFLAQSWEAAPAYYSAASVEHGGERFAVLAAALRDAPLRARALPASDVDELDADAARQDAVRDGAGGPALHGQDVRLVRSGGAAESFFCAHGDAVDASVVRAALAAGFTVAMRAVNLRQVDAAAAAAAAVSATLQLPCAVNTYTTPPGARGLARHYDDHCALVLQLEGRKCWRVWPAACGVTLPRLFEARAAPRCNSTDAQTFRLAPGDVLYVPRGHPHEAHADADDGDGRSAAVPSTHATLALEVPPPFEWAAALHVAVRLAAGSALQWSHAEALLHAGVRDAGDGEGADHDADDAARLRAACLGDSLTAAAPGEDAYARLVARLRRVSYGAAVTAAARFVAAGDAGLAWSAWLSHLPTSAAATQQQQAGDWRSRADALCDVLEAAPPPPSGREADECAFRVLQDAAVVQPWELVRAHLAALRRRYLAAHAARAHDMRQLHNSGGM